MNKVQAENIIKGYSEHWGEGKTFDITVESKSDETPSMLLMALNHAGKMTDSERLELLNGIDIVALNFKRHSQKKAMFEAAVRSILPDLRQAIFDHRNQDAILLTEALWELVVLGEVTRHES
ncbi:hypothetical protein [Vibrio harveyi]|uniref:hypothetical protein n=1 Tax=Vibrio harveyi TaxID=669 RepID=UPI0025AEF17E|nr:hypothetical protein [Vibrio harveyi]WJT09250.1 hypothetical protein PH545_24805 [Vibrio harveyi]